MDDHRIPLKTLIEANEALRAVAEMSGNATHADWMHVAMRCTRAGGALGWHIDQLTKDIAAQADTKEAANG